MKPVEPIAHPQAAPKATLLHRGQLFRKYFLLILALVCGALLISGGIGLYFAYQENKVAVASLQREKAAGAAARIEQFVREIEQQVAAAALPQLGTEGLEQRRLEFLKLLRMVDRVTDISQIDARGREQLSVSRLKPDEVGSGHDRSQEPAFKNARPGQMWFGPVYFRKETEPYMSMSIRAGGERGAVTVAEVNLKFMWDVITRIRVGQKGKAYVVDATGHLIADPDIGLVLRKTDLSALQQVKEALAPDADDSLAFQAKDLAGLSVLTAFAPIEPARDKPPTSGAAPSPLGWKVFVEQPVSEVYAVLDATIYRTVALIVAGLLFSALVAMYLARSMARPISVLQEGAQRIGAGDLDQKIDVRTGDELEALAGQFNRMTEQLRESYSGLERKVEERTAELQKALERQTATSEILRVISSTPTDTQPVFEAIVAATQRLIAGKRAGIILRRGDHFVAVAFSGEGFRELPEQIRTVALDRERNFPSRAILDGQVVHVTDWQADDVPEFEQQVAAHYGVKSGVIVPLLRQGEGIGALAVARDTAGPYQEKEIALLQSFADQAVIAIENVRLFNETKESLERQTATSDVLAAISGAQTDVGPVFEAIARNAQRLCNAVVCNVLRYDGEMLHIAASHGFSAEQEKKLREKYPVRAGDTSVISGRVILNRRIEQIDDVQTDAEYDQRHASDVAGWRRMLAVPMLRDELPLGVIVVAWRDPGKATESEVELLKTFAAQASIAIENVRLFNETKEALEQQTATAEILRVISGSTSDVQPVFDAIVLNAARLVSPCNAGILMREGDYLQLRSVAGPQATPENRAALANVYPVRFDPKTTLAGRVISERRMMECLDTEAPDALEVVREAGRAGKYRSFTLIPLVREAEGIGALGLTHPQPGFKLTAKQVTLLQTFADQAVIAIENVRLFNQTKEALEQETATSDILRVISDSPGDDKPILHAVAEHAGRLCEATAVAIYALEGQTLRRTAFHGPAELSGRDTLPYVAGSLTGRTIAQGKPIHIEDLERAQTEFPITWEAAQRFGRRHTMLAVPLTREGRAFGAMFLRRTEVKPFSERQIALSKMFADQAAIGIENVRLFNETKEALEQQKASADVLGAISASIADTAPVFDKILESCQRLFEGYLVGVTLVEADGRVHLRAYKGEAQDELTRIYPMPLSRESGTGSAILQQRTVEFSDVRNDPSTPPQVKKGAAVLGFSSIVFAPMVFEGAGIGAIWVARKLPGAFGEKQLALLKTFADQAVIAIQNARLFREIQEKSAQLEVANKHKSEFLANMSHELRTPLNAIIGFSEVLTEKMFGELNEKQLDYLKDIHDSGRHLLSLINDILDLSKIEAGRMDLEVSSFDLPAALSNAMTLVRERAQRHGIELNLKVDKRLGAFQADERKFKQIVLNLLSNAVKFTPDGGRVAVSAKKDTTHVEIAVTDTGIGIAPEDHAAVFEEFKQVGRDYTKKAEGTGLGLALTKRFVELHGGEIHLKSALGKGSTFTITLPVRQ